LTLSEIPGNDTGKEYIPENDKNENENVYSFYFLFVVITETHVSGLYIIYMSTTILFCIDNLKMYY